MLRKAQHGDGRGATAISRGSSFCETHALELWPKLLKEIHANDNHD